MEKRRLTQKRVDTTLLSLELVCDSKNIRLEDSSEYMELTNILTEVDFGELCFDDEYDTIQYLLERVIIFVSKAIA